jgi:SAM-dependent methyltransferase
MEWLMPPIGDDPARWLSDVLLPVMRYRLALLGAEDSGAYDFYRTRLATGRVFGDYEVRLIDEIMRRQLPVREVHEIGCGWGQLVFLLAWRGYDATGFEIDRRRFCGATCLREILGLIDPARAGRASLRHQFFPPLDRPDAQGSLVIATNIVVDNPRFVEDQILRGLRRYRYAVIDIDRFCAPRGPAEHPQFLVRAEQSGLRDLGLFCDAGAEGHFHLFEPSAGAGGEAADEERQRVG